MIIAVWMGPVLSRPYCTTWRRMPTISGPRSLPTISGGKARWRPSGSSLPNSLRASASSISTTGALRSSSSRRSRPRVGGVRVAQQGVEAGPRCAHRRQETEGDAGQHREREGESEDRSIDVDLGIAAEDLGRPGQERVQSPEREQNAAPAAREREENALDQKLAHQLPAARAQPP